MAYPSATSAEPDDPLRSMTPEQRKKFLKLARDRFKQATDADKKQRDREREDLRFYAGDQWPQDIQDRRKAQPAKGNLPAAPERPCITINNTREPVRQVLNQERQSDMGIEIVAADDFGDLNDRPDDTEITLREGLVRRIQRESQAADARTWAFARAVQAGRGFYGVMTRFCQGKTNDQEIYIQRYYDQSSVLLDPAHEQPDGSDAEWGFVGNDLPYDVYKAEHKRRNGQPNRVCSYGETDWRADGDEPNDWFTAEGDLRMCRVVDYWYTVRTTRAIVAYRNAEGEEVAEWADDVPSAPAGWVEIDGSRRDVIEKSIKWAKIDGCDDDVLEETEWPGPDMPIVKVLGEELQPYDNERRVEGMIRPMRGAAQGFNYMVSRWVEVIGLSPIVPIMLAAGVDEGYEDEWDAIATRTLGRVHYNQTDLEGKTAPPPTSSPAQNPPIQAIAGSVEVFDRALKSTSGIEAAALGQADSSVRSNKQAQLLVEQSRMGSNHYLDNMQRSVRYEGQIVNNLLFPIYGRKGRIARIVNGEGDAEDVILHRPMRMQAGRPVPAQDGEDGATTYKLTKDAKFNVIIKVSKNFDSRRQQEAQTIGELLSSNPELMAWFGDLFFANQDGPGHQQMADRAKVMLDPKIQQMLAAKSQGKNVPPEVQAQLAGAQQQIESLTAQLQEASAPGAVEQIKAQATNEQTAAKLQADVEIARIKAESGERIEAMKQQTALTIEEWKLRGTQMQAEMDAAEAERARVAGLEQAAGAQDHEVGMAALEQQHAREMAEAGHAQSLESAEMQAGTSAEQAEAQRAHEAAMAERAAAQQTGGEA